MEKLYVINRFADDAEASADDEKPTDPDRTLKKILKKAKKKQEQARLSLQAQIIPQEETEQQQDSGDSPRRHKRKLGDLGGLEELERTTTSSKKSKVDRVTDTPKQAKKHTDESTSQGAEGLTKLSGAPRKKKRRKKSKQIRNRHLNEAGHKKGSLVTAEATALKTDAAPVKTKKKRSDTKSVQGSTNNKGDGEQSIVTPLVEPVQNPDSQETISQPEEAKEETESATAQGVEYFPVLGEVESKTTEVVHRVLPDWLSNPETIESRVKKRKTPVNNFGDSLSAEMLLALTANKIRKFFPVQEKVVPWLLSSAQRRSFLPPRDVCVSAPTGSGKTLAYVIPIVESLKSRVVRAVRAVVVLPVKELAVQVQSVFRQYTMGTSVRSELVMGTKSLVEEQALLVRKNARGYISLVDIVVATPGRLLAHIRKTPGFSLQQLKFFVLDEADRVVEDVRTTLIPEVEHAVFGSNKRNCCCCGGSAPVNARLFTQPLTICSLQHCRDPVQKLLYSATLTQDPEKLQSLMLFQPKLFTAMSADSTEQSLLDHTPRTFTGKYTTPQGLREFYCISQNIKKPLALWYLVAKRGFSGTLCFTGTKEETHRLCLVLKEMGEICVEEFSSDLSATRRKRTLQKFASGRLDLLVCSNVLARGLDVGNVRNVICYDPPKYIKTYVHRVGRTARAGVPGTAVTFLSEGQLKAFLAMLASAGKKDLEPLDKMDTELVVFHKQYREALKKVEEVVSQEIKKAQSRKRLKFPRKDQLPTSALGEKKDNDDVSVQYPQSLSDEQF